MTPAESPSDRTGRTELTFTQSLYCPEAGRVIAHTTVVGVDSGDVDLTRVVEMVSRMLRGAGFHPANIKEFIDV